MGHLFEQNLPLNYAKYLFPQDFFSKDYKIAKLKSLYEKASKADLPTIGLNLFYY